MTEKMMAIEWTAWTFTSSYLTRTNISIYEEQLHYLLSTSTSSVHKQPLLVQCSAYRDQKKLDECVRATGNRRETSKKGIENCAIANGYWLWIMNCIFIQFSIDIKQWHCILFRISWAMHRIHHAKQFYQYNRKEFVCVCEYSFR